MIPGRSVSMSALADRLCALPPVVGQVRVVALDGHAGSGKSTVAAQLSAALGDAPVLHLDDVASHRTFFGWTDQVIHEVLCPLAEGRTARYRVYDWQRAGFHRAASLAPAPVVLIEGVGAGRRALRPYLSFLAWMDVPAEVAWRRGLRRDGPELTRFWDQWTAAERQHFADDPSMPYADILLTP